ncbi:hypothetical protein P9112_009023 [Eukaryota sp. TZLM1-RC]
MFDSVSLPLTCCAPVYHKNGINVEVSTDSISLLSTSTSTISKLKSVDVQTEVFRTIHEYSDEDISSIVASFHNCGLLDTVYNALDENDRYISDGLNNFRFHETTTKSTIMTTIPSNSSLSVLTSSPTNIPGRFRNIALCFASLTHNGYCNHTTDFHLYYSLSSSTDSPLTFSLPSCVTCITSHPYKPTVFVLGFYTGTICIINTSRKGNPIIAQNDNVITRAPVVRVDWIGSGVVGVNSDGQVTIYKYPGSKTSSLKSIKSSQLLIDHSSASVTSTFLSIKNNNQFTFLIGWSSGHFYQYSLLYDSFGDLHNISEINGIEVYKFSSGVSAIDVFNNNLNLVIASSSSEVCLINLTEYSLIKTILVPGFSLISSLMWVFDNIVIFGANSGHLFVYDLNQIDCPVERILVSSYPINCLAKSNWNDSEVIVAGDIKGGVSIISLAEVFSKGKLDIEKN